MTAATVPGANRAGLVGSAAVHVLMVAALLVAARRASEPPPLVYEVNLVAAPAPGPAPRRAAEAATPVRRDEEVAPPVKPPTRKQAEEAPPKPKPETPPVRDEKAVRTRADVEPLPGETPSTGTDQLTFRQEGMRFPYPDYLENIVTQVKKRWANPVGPGLRLRTEVAFTIQRDGTVTDITYSRRSGNFTFDTEALGAIERAGRDRAFGPLPSGWNGESLPIAFSFTPEDR